MLYVVSIKKRCFHFFLMKNEIEVRDSRIQKFKIINNEKTKKSRLHNLFLKISFICGTKNKPLV